MHDPCTQAFVIPCPWWKRNRFDNSRYFPPFITIWHDDPETDHTDDSCGWFKRARHGDKAVLAKIKNRFDEDWDRVYEYQEDDCDGRKIGPIKSRHYRGFFYPENAGSGAPNMGVMAIAINLFFIAAMEHFKVDGRSNWKKARRWMQRNLFDIMLFAENPTDSLKDLITRAWGTEQNRQDRIEEAAAIIYGWILRNTMHWWQHPRWHVWHWRLQIHPWQHFKRRFIERCSKCGGHFKRGESAIGSWSGTRIWHDRCDDSSKPIKT